MPAAVAVVTTHANTMCCFAMLCVRCTLCIVRTNRGVDVMSLEKTDKTLAELEVELNKSYDFSKVWQYVHKLLLIIIEIS
jgi:hypothetical protein